MLYAGVRRIYLYDHFMFVNESLQEWCNQQFPDIVVYREWKALIPYSITGTQVAAYEHAPYTEIFQSGKLPLILMNIRSCPATKEEDF